MTDFEKVATEALALPLQNRADLAEMLVQSLDEEDELQIRSAWLAEIHRRDREIRVGKSVTRPACAANKPAGTDRRVQGDIWIS